MTAELWFVTTILPLCVMTGGWVVYKLNERWLERELQRERARAKAKR